MKLGNIVTSQILPIVLIGISGFLTSPARAQHIDKPDRVETFPAGTTPMFLAFDGANIWASNTFADTVTKLRASDGTLLGSFAVGDEPPVHHF